MTEPTIKYYSHIGLAAAAVDPEHAVRKGEVDEAIEGLQMQIGNIENSWSGTDNSFALLEEKVTNLESLAFNNIDNYDNPNDLSSRVTLMEDRFFRLLGLLENQGLDVDI